jgi:hypothetical protein
MPFSELDADFSARMPLECSGTQECLDSIRMAENSDLPNDAAAVATIARNPLENVAHDPPLDADLNDTYMYHARGWKARSFRGFEQV